MNIFLNFQGGFFTVYGVIRLKGIVSQDLHICFLVTVDKSQVPTPYGTIRLLFKLSFPG
jgi:hypothetical protein